jgi:hypothetical protein
MKCTRAMPNTVHWNADDQHNAFTCHVMLYDVRCIMYL